MCHYFWTRIAGTNGTGSNMHKFHIRFINSQEHYYSNDSKLETSQLQAELPLYNTELFWA